MNASSFDFDAQQRLQFRLQMIENYRQTCAMTFAAGMLVRPNDPDAPESDVKKVAKRAKAAADALVAEVFPEGE
jgi:hypothetical protein